MAVGKDIAVTSVFSCALGLAPVLFDVRVGWRIGFLLVVVYLIGGIHGLVLGQAWWKGG